MQAILDANRNTHEYVREAIVNNDKVNNIYLYQQMNLTLCLASSSYFSINNN